MVMSTETTRNTNGRSKSPTNGITSKPAANNEPQLTPETSDDESQSKKNLGKKNGKSEFEEKIRVGKDYQVIVPEMLPVPRPDNYPDKALLVWAPAKDIPDLKLDEYINLAKERYGYNAEQALGMLFWHKHDLEKAVLDLPNFTPFPDEWTKEDKIMFEQAFQFHGKCFHRIRQMLPDKSIACLVRFYYSWKKTRSRTNDRERQEKKKMEGGSELGSENGTPEDSDAEKIDSDDDVQLKDDGIDNINEIIGIGMGDGEKKVEKKSMKTSIMTPSSGGKSSATNTAAAAGIKRKLQHNDDVELIEDDDDEPVEKKISKSEITITPIPKNSDDKKESQAVISVL